MASRFSERRGGNVGIEKRSNSFLLLLLLLFLPGPPVSWRSKRLPARPVTSLLEEEDGPAMASEESEGDVSTTTSIGLRRRQKKRKKGSRSEAAAAAVAAPCRARAGRGAKHDARPLSRARCACVRCPARFSGEREGKRKRKKMNSTSVDFAVLLFSASFASARFSTLFSF